MSEAAEVPMPSVSVLRDRLIAGIARGYSELRLVGARIACGGGKPGSIAKPRRLAEFGTVPARALFCSVA